MLKCYDSLTDGSVSCGPALCLPSGRQQGQRAEEADIGVVILVDGRPLTALAGPYRAPVKVSYQ